MEVKFMIISRGKPNLAFVVSTNKTEAFLNKETKSTVKDAVAKSKNRRKELEERAKCISVQEK